LHNVGGVTVRVYSPAKSVVDCFKFRRRVGIDAAVRGLRAYLAKHKRDEGALTRYMAVCRMTRVMRPYLDALDASLQRPKRTRARHLPTR
jgi:hypothetical protein